MKEGEFRQINKGDTIYHISGWRRLVAYVKPMVRWPWRTGQVRFEGTEVYYNCDGVFKSQYRSTSEGLNIKEVPPTKWRPRMETGCWVWPYSSDRNGYSHIRRDGRSQKAYKWMYELIKGKVPKGLQLDHLCRNKLCINPEHLEPVTQAENSRRGLSAKLKKEDVLKIRALKGEMTAVEIGKIFGVCGQAVYSIFNGKTWKDIK